MDQPKLNNREGGYKWTGLKAPFTYFGGKSRIASEVWRRFGDVASYIEPFAGSLAVMLARPHKPKIETVNDSCHFIANVWRAIKADPDGVLKYTSDPIHEVTLSARHYWLVTEGANRLATLMPYPDKYDVKVAGWWVWGMGNWLGRGWCDGRDGWSVNNGRWVFTDAASRVGIQKQLPKLSNIGGIKAEHLRKLALRLSRVRVTCGDWSRICQPSVTKVASGYCAAMLDPPYGEGNYEYASGGNADTSVAESVREWAISEGKNPWMRVALCGYENQFEMPANWSVYKWKAHGGYGLQAKADDTIAKQNAFRERVWFSPACIAHKSTLFSE